jgi:amidase/aspartyl-tRNA(Asn)/glutamyl-tRNA(Gln) amidotransferase subunit A
VADAVEKRTEHAFDVLEDAGASVVDVSIENYDSVTAVKNALSVTELIGHWRDAGAPIRRGGIVDDAYQTALHARFATGGGELGVHYKGKLLAGAQLLAAHGGRHYTRAQAAREVIATDLELMYDDVDVVATPTMPDIAPFVSERENPGFDYGRNLRIADVTGHPAITLPNGTVDGLPVALQLMGSEFGEADLLGVAARVETALS